MSSFAPKLNVGDIIEIDRRGRQEVSMIMVEAPFTATFVFHGKEVTVTGFPHRFPLGEVPDTMEASVEDVKWAIIKTFDGMRHGDPILEEAKAMTLHKEYERLGYMTTLLDYGRDCWFVFDDEVPAN